MTNSTKLERLRPGRDVNDSSWVIARYFADWRAAVSTDVFYDHGSGALGLRPLARPELAADWAPVAPVAAPDGTLYVADTEQDLLLTRGVCDTDFVPVPGIGGSGWATGRFNTPLGVAVDDKGRVYVADTGNGRVQVIDPAEPAVVALLDDGLECPVHVAVGSRGKIYVVDAVTGRLHVFSASYKTLSSLELATLDPWTGEPWSAPPKPDPRAVAILDDGSLVVFDPVRPALWHMTAAGRALTGLPWPDPDALPAGWKEAPRRYSAFGDVVLGPIDGGTHNLAWHRVLVEAETPKGTSLLVQTFASNDDTETTLPWAPADPVAIPAATDGPGREADRLVLADQRAWPRWKVGRMRRAKPEIWRFEGDGPVSADRFTLPAAAAARLRSGDRVVLTTDQGGTTDATIVDAALRPTRVAASGPPAAAAGPSSLSLIARDGSQLPHGPLDLGFLLEPAILGSGPAGRDGRPETFDLPHALTAFLQPGDVLAYGSAAGELRIEIVELSHDPVEFQLAQALEGDFATSTLTIEDSAGRLLVREPLPDAPEVPVGTTVTVMDDVHTEPAAVTAIDSATGTIWLAAPGLSGSLTPTSWSNAQFAEAKATDRGRYLWVRLQLRGAALRARDGVGPSQTATETPWIRALRVTGPRSSLLDWLPAVFSPRDPRRDPPGANFLERFLTLFEGEFTRIETAYESVSRLLNPQASDDTWLIFLASWMDLAFDPSWPIERRRLLVIEGAALQAARGTPAALSRYLEIYTGHRPAITEGFNARPPRLIQLGGPGVLGVAALGGGEAPDRFSHRFTVSVTLPADVDRQAARSAVLQIIETMKPAHTQFRLESAGEQAIRIGMGTQVGAVVVPGPGRHDPCACDPDQEGTRPHAGTVPGGFRVGGRLGGNGISEFVPKGV